MSAASLFGGVHDMIGEDVTIAVDTGGTYNPATDTVTGETTTNYTARGVFYEYANELVDGTSIQSGDLACDISAAGLTIVPKAGNRVVRDSVDLYVVSVKERSILGEIVSYELQVRGNG